VKNLLLAGIALVALAAPAAAADMPLKAPAPVAIDIWTGGYVGANVGYDWGRSGFDSTGSRGTCTQPGLGCTGGTTDSDSQFMASGLTFNTTLNHSGLIYGGQAGHNWLVHNMFWTTDGVLGVEVDFQGKSDSHSTTYSTFTPNTIFPANPVSTSATLNEKINTLGTLRGRAGVLWGPSTLIYATAGLAWASASASANYNQFLNGPFAPATAPFAGGGSVNTELFGPVIGAGIEWKWTANLSIKAEYLYADLGNLAFNTNTLFAPQVGTGFTYGAAQANVSTHVRDSIARVGVNWKLW
jgi:outer membrane immunogenic protein